MNTRLASLLAAAALNAAASAQTVEFRIVERTGQTQVTPGGDVVLDFAVQAKVTAGAVGTALCGFAFDIVMVGEPDASGLLAKGLISNPDHTYAAGFSANSAVGSGGLAAQYDSLANISAVFNGSINTSVASFTNTPGNQEIGLVTGAMLSPAILATPGMDPLGEGNPATWSGYGHGATPIFGSTAALDPAIGAGFFAEGQFVDVYRFRYTVTDFTGRQINVTLRNVAVQAFGQFLFTNNTWGPQCNTLGANELTVTGVSIVVGVPGACCDAASSACTMVLGGACTGTFMNGGTCSPSPCPDPQGQCCDMNGCTTTTLANCPQGNTWTLTCCNSTTGACTTTTNPACAAGNAWMVAAACTPNPCPTVPQGSCCVASSGACTVTAQSACDPSNVWTGGAGCTPNPCPQVHGACCASTGCRVTTQADCQAGHVWLAQVGCPTAACPGECCDVRTGACTTTNITNCQGTFQSWTVNGTCEPNPCGPPGVCCSDDSSYCSVIIQRWCIGPVHQTWTANATCAVHPCPIPVGSCCEFSTGHCLTTTYVVCANMGRWTVAQGCTPYPCPDLGACCLTTDNTCQILPLDECINTGNHLWAREGSVCAPNPCPTLPGACCVRATGGCAVTTRGVCNSNTSDWLLLTTCSPNRCIQPGRCCNFITGACWFLPQAACGSGAHTWLQGGSCSPNPCSMAAACCNSQTGACIRRTMATCTGPSQTWMQSAVCSSLPCPQPLGTCCVAGACQGSITQGGCLTLAGTWTFGGSCAPNPCVILFSRVAVATCAADFDQSGVLTVADIVAFMNAWLAGDIRADFDRSQRVDIQDVFAFLNGWFSGCS
jgi:hypothetical protein